MIALRDRAATAADAYVRYILAQSFSVRARFAQ